MDRAKAEAWLRERAGLITASRFKDVLSFTKGGKSSADREAYLAKVVVERLTKEPASMVFAQALGWGSDVEPYARNAYEVRTGAVVREVDDTLIHHAYPFVGATPDGLIDPSGGFESKCPANSMIHMQTLVNGMPEEHLSQVQGCMWVAQREWWDFVSYDPRMPPRLRLYVQRVERDEQYIAKLEAAALAFEEEVQTWLTKLEAV